MNSLRSDHTRNIITKHLLEKKSISTANEQLILQDAPLSGATEAHDLLPKLMSFVPGVVMDSTPYGYDFGDLLRDANKTYVAVSCVEYIVSSLSVLFKVAFYITTLSSL